MVKKKLQIMLDSHRFLSVYLGEMRNQRINEKGKNTYE